MSNSDKRCRGVLGALAFTCATAGLAGDARMDELFKSVETARDLESVRYVAEINLANREGDWRGRCMIRWSGKTAFGSLSFSRGEFNDNGLTSNEEICLPIEIDNSVDGVFRLTNRTGSTHKFTAVLAKRVYSDEGVNKLLWEGSVMGLGALFCPDKPDDKIQMHLWRVLRGERSQILDPKKDQKASWQPGPPDDWLVSGVIHLEVKPGKEFQAKAYLENTGLPWMVGSDFAPWGWTAWAPNFSEESVKKELEESGLFDEVSRESPAMGPGDEISLFCRTDRIFKVNPWMVPQEAQLQSRAFFKKIVTEAFGGKAGVDIEWLALSKAHCYRALITGPSAAIGRGATGMWEQHQVEVEFTDATPFAPEGSKQFKRRDYVELNITQITCKSAYGDKPPPVQRYTHDDSHETLRFLQRFGDSVMEHENAIIEPGGMADIIFPNVDERAKQQTAKQQ